MEKRKMNEIIREQRKKQNLTQEQLAEKLNVSSKTISKWETGTRLPDTDIILALADALNISVEELFNGVKFDKELVKNYDYHKINKFKKQVLIAILLLFSPILMFLGTILQSLTLFYVFLIAGFLCIIFSFYLLISAAINFKYLINNKNNQPKYTLVYKNNLLTYLIIFYTLVFILLGVTDNILFPIILNVLFSIFIFLVIYFIPIDINIKKMIPFIILSIFSFVLGCILTSLIAFLPYYLFLFLSQICVFIAMFIQNNYRK